MGMKQMSSPSQSKWAIKPYVVMASQPALHGQMPPAQLCTSHLLGRGDPGPCVWVARACLSLRHSCVQAGNRAAGSQRSDIN